MRPQPSTIFFVHHLALQLQPTISTGFLSQAHWTSKTTSYHAPHLLQLNSFNPSAPTTTSTHRLPAAMAGQPPDRQPTMPFVAPPTTHYAGLESKGKDSVIKTQLGVVKSEYRVYLQGELVTIYQSTPSPNASCMSFRGAPGSKSDSAGAQPGPLVQTTQLLWKRPRTIGK